MSESKLFYNYGFQNQIKNLQKVLSKGLLFLQILNVNSTMFGTLEVLDHPFKLKIMLNTTAALFTKIIGRVVKPMLVNP